MSSPEIDERFKGLVRELRSARVAAPEALRERVREIARGEPEPPPARQPRLRRRRAVLVLAPAAVAAAAVTGVVVGVVASDDGGERVVSRGALPSQKQAPVPEAARRSLDLGKSAVAPSLGRAQQYEAELTIRVGDLSEATKRALRLTRSLGGYVRTADYGSGERSGTAHLVVRIPIGGVQEAIVRFSSLGTILDQRVSVRDIQPSIDRRFRRMQALRAEIAKLTKRIASLGADSPEREYLEAELARVRGELVALQREQRQARRQASLATVSLGLRSGEAGAAAPAEPGRLERALDGAADVLVKELVVLVYVFVVGAPFVLLAALALGGARTRRRRLDERLLAP